MSIFSFLLTVIACLVSTGRTANTGASNWGLLVDSNTNAGVPIKGTYFFAGDALSDRTLPCCAGSSTYTFFPIDPRNLFWTSQPLYCGEPGSEINCSNARTYVIQQMMAAGVNVIMMSYWGSECCAPMQTTDAATDALFEATIGTPLKIIPAVEIEDGPSHLAAVASTASLRAMRPPPSITLR
jgi:hypothetical protein